VVGPSKWSAQGLFTVAFLGITAGVQMSDMGLQAISLSAIQDTFNVSDAALGALQGLAGVLVGSALAVPLARFADRYSRKRVLLWLILASTAMMVLSAIAPNFPLFFLGRSAAGITEFAMVPLVYSMIPDLAPERHRVPANLGFAALMAIGASGGFYFAGTLLSVAGQLPLDIEPWRKAFLLLSFAGIPLLAGCLFTVNPPRTLNEADTAAHGSLRHFLWERRQTVAYFVGTAGFLVLAVQALNHLVSLALERRFDTLPDQVGQPMGMIVLLSSMGCLPVAWLLDRLLSRRWSRAARPMIMAACVLPATVTVSLLASAATLGHALWAVGVTLFLTSTANALVPTIVQDLTPATLRARCFAIWSFVVSVFGATGPVVAGALSSTVLTGRMIEAVSFTAVPALLVSAYCGLRSFLLAGARPHAMPGKGPQ